MRKSIALILPFLAMLLLAGAALAQTPAGEPAPLGIEAVVELGLPVGDISLPWRVALNESAGELYLLSQGAYQQGNAIAVFDAASGDFTGRLPLNTGGDFEPLDLQFDPASGLLYALWRDRAAATATRPTLSVIDSKTMQLVEDIPNIESFAAVDGILYTANAGELAAVNLSNNSYNQARRGSLFEASATGPLAVDAAAGRLYLARSTGPDWTLEIFEAGSFNPVATVLAEGQIRDILPLPAAGQVLYTTPQGSFRMLNRLTTEGDLADLPFELGPYSGANGIALSPDGRTLFYSNGLYPPITPDDPSPGPALVGIDSQTLAETHFIALLGNVEDIAVGSDNSAYAVQPYDDLLYSVNLTRETFDVAKTLVRVQGATVDAASGDLFVTDSANRVRRLGGDTLAVQAETRLQNNWADFGFRRWEWSGQLALDDGRERLYISGLPATVVDAATLEEVDGLNPGGQITAAAGHPNLYISNCGITALPADSLSGGVVISGTTQRPDQLSPNPCVTASQLDAANQWLYSEVSNGVAGSNGGYFLTVYDVSNPEASPVFTDPNISVFSLAADGDGRRAYVNFVRNSQSRLLLLDLPAGRYTQQLLGLSGETRYSPAANRLYLVDAALNRLLALDGDSLSIVDELSLPPDSDYRLLALDPATDRLFLADDSGQLLVAAPGATSGAAATPAAELPASGAVLSLAQPANSPVFARINAPVGQFSSEAHPYASDKGESWLNLSANLPPFPLQSLAVSPNFAQDATLFASIYLPGQSGGLYRSTDGGATWQPAMAGLRDVWVDRLFIAPTFADTGLIVAQTPYAGLHLSTDGGDSWQPLADLDPNETFPTSNTGFAAAFSDNGTVLVSQAMEGMSGLYRATLSPAGRLSAWEPLFDVPATVLGLSPEGDIALAYGSGLWRSDDGGDSWQQVGQGLSGVENLAAERFIFSPDFAADQTVYFFFRGDSSVSGQLFRSTDAGLSWQPWLPPDRSAIFSAITLTPDGDFLLGDDAAGLTRLAPADITWAKSPLPGANFPAEGIAMSGDTLFVVNGQQGLYRSGSGGRGWELTGFPARSAGFGLKPFQVVLSPGFAADATMFVTTGQSLQRSTDGGDNWQQVGGALHAQQVALSPNFAADATLLVSTAGSVARSDDGGLSWATVLTSPLEAGSGSDVLAFAPDGQTAFARFGYGSQLFRSDDGGQTWQPQPAGMDDYFSIISAAVDGGGTLNAAVEYDRKLLQSPPWQNLSDSLPAELTGLNAVAAQPDSGLLYAAGQGGVFSSGDGGATWSALPTGGLPPDASVTRLAVDGPTLLIALSDGSLYALGEGEFGWKNVSVIK